MILDKFFATCIRIRETDMKRIQTDPDPKHCFPVMEGCVMVFLLKRPSHNRLIHYSITQSLSNSLLGDVVSDSFNKVYRDDDSILDKTYRKQICSEFYYDNF